jgi:large subunit ribosomal protein L31e
MASNQTESVEEEEQLSNPESKEETAAEPAEEEIKEEMKGAPAEEVAQPETEEVETEEATPAAAAEEAPEEEGEEEIEVVEEKVYTIPLRHVWTVTPRGKRAPRAVRDVRDYVARHMKSDEVAISNEINTAIWSRSINKPPRKITVRAVKDKEGKVIVYPTKGA